MVVLADDRHRFVGCGCHFPFDGRLPARFCVRLVMAKMGKRTVPGPFVIVDAAGETLRDERGAVREFSTEKRAAGSLRPGDKVSIGKR